MDAQKLRALQIDPQAKVRSQSALWFVFLGVALLTAFVAYQARPRKDDDRRPFSASKSKADRSGTAAPATAAAVPAPSPQAQTPGPTTGSVLTVSGYIVNRERIEISPRFLGQVQWI